MTPEDFMGDVIGDLNSRRGAHQGMEPRGGAQVDHAPTVPLAEMFGYVDRPALDDAGPRDLHDAVLALRARCPKSVAAREVGRPASERSDDGG